MSSMFELVEQLRRAKTHDIVAINLREYIILVSGSSTTTMELDFRSLAASIGMSTPESRRNCGPGCVVFAVDEQEEATEEFFRKHIHIHEAMLMMTTFKEDDDDPTWHYYYDVPLERVCIVDRFGDVIYPHPHHQDDFSHEPDLAVDWNKACH